MKTDIPNPLDPQPGPVIGFHRAGNRILLGNRPTRLASIITETETGRISITSYDPRTGDEVETVDVWFTERRCV